MKNIKLFILDIDHTITSGPSIWEIMHQECGTWENQGKKYLEQFLAGEFDFDQFARLDAAAWKDQPIQLLKKAISLVQLTPGIEELMAVLKQKQILTAIISGSIGQFADYLADKFNIDFIFANPLGTRAEQLDGTIQINVPGEGKAEVAEKLIRSLRLHKDDVAVVGDSRFDLPMFEHAGHSFIMGNEKYKNHGRYFVRDFHEIVRLL